MKKCLLSLLALITLLAAGCGGISEISGNNALSSQSVVVKLPEPRMDSEVSLEKTLLERRSVREYSGESLSLTDVSQLLWAAQGVTSDLGQRTAPSAGGLYPLEVYLVTGDVEGLPPGSYRYLPGSHEITMVRSGDLRAQLSEAALSQEWVQEGAVNFVISAVYDRTTQKYGDRGVRYVHMEAGHAAQNLCLEVVVLNLGAVTVGAFDDNKVKELVGMTEDEVPLYVIPVGKIA